jgi:hypothetical protein
MYPHAKREFSNPSPSGRNAWIVVEAADGKQSSIQYIASVTEEETHCYPLFIFTTQDVSRMSRAQIEAPVREIIRALSRSVPIQRIFSVFAPTRITNVFANMWSETTDIDIVQEPYYDATFSACTPETLSARPAPLEGPYQWELRRGEIEDIPAIAELCYDFASECAPFFHSQKSAIREAKHLVSQRQVWIHRIRRSDADGPWEIASVCAVTRATSEVAAITKVFTNRRWRRLGCAERLTWQVTRDLLKTHQQVVLYVGNANSAARVYNRLGFQGLDGKLATPDPASHWLELGFDPKMTELGFW